MWFTVQTQRQKYLRISSVLPICYAFSLKTILLLDRLESWALIFILLVTPKFLKAIFLAIPPSGYKMCGHLRPPNNTRGVLGHTPICLCLFMLHLHTLILLLAFQVSFPPPRLSIFFLFLLPFWLSSPVSPFLPLSLPPSIFLPPHPVPLYLDYKLKNFWIGLFLFTSHLFVSFCTHFSSSCRISFKWLQCWYFFLFWWHLTSLK